MCAWVWVCGCAFSLKLEPSGTELGLTDLKVLADKMGVVWQNVLGQSYIALMMRL